eukprot:165654-Pelagomonas_calceolata.AAC.1
MISSRAKPASQDLWMHTSKEAGERLEGSAPATKANTSSTAKSDEDVMSRKRLQARRGYTHTGIHEDGVVGRRRATCIVFSFGWPSHIPTTFNGTDQSDPMGQVPTTFTSAPEQIKFPSFLD